MNTMIQTNLDALETKLTALEATKQRIEWDDEDVEGTHFYWKVNQAQFKACRARLEAFMQQLLPKESAYLKTLQQKVQSSHYEDFETMQALFDEFKNHINQGLLTSLQNHHQASVFNTLLNQAHAHLQQDNTQAATTLMHAVLTTSLKTLATNHNINDKTTQTINDALTQAGAYNTIQQQQIHTWLNQSIQPNLSLAETQTMLEGLKNFLATTMT